MSVGLCHSIQTHTVCVCACVCVHRDNELRQDIYKNSSTKKCSAHIRTHCAATYLDSFHFQCHSRQIYTHACVYLCVCESCAQSFSSFLFFAYRAHSAHTACRSERAAMQRERERFRRESASAAEGKRSCLPNMAERTKAVAAEYIGKAWSGTARKDNAMHCVCVCVCVLAKNG